MILAQIDQAPINLPSVDYRSILPALILIGGALLLLGIGGLNRKRPPAGSYALFTIVTAGVALWFSFDLWDQVDADKARSVFAIKRSKNPGFAGIDNQLYFSDRTWMLFGDAKNVIGELVKQLAPGSGMH